MLDINWTFRPGFSAILFSFCAGCSVLLTVLAVAGLFVSDYLVGFFRDDPEVIAIGSFALKIQLCALVFQPLSICINMTLQSVGKNKAATFLSAVRSGVAFIPVIIILTKLMGLTGVQIAQPVADVLTFAVAVPFTASFFKHLPADE